MESQFLQESRASLVVALAALASAVAFHVLFYGRQYGVAFAMFMLVLFAGVHVLTAMTGKRGNAWAYVFAVPLACALAAEAVYASEAVRALGLLISVGSLALFTYWFTAPRMRFRDALTLWPMSLFFESFFPFPRFLEYLNRLIKGKRHVSRVLVGAVIAVPFLLVIGYLFASADALIRNTIGALFVAENVVQLFVRLLWDAFAFVFFASAGWTLVTRLVETRNPKHATSGMHRVDHVVAGTFLILLNVLFAAFLAFQTVSFFGGESFMQSRGISYAEYAREGFFQLLAVSVIVTGIIAAVYRYADIRNRLIRISGVLLIIQTGLVMVAALRRMQLYVDAYGFSVQRVWATLMMCVIAGLLVFGVIAIIANLTFGALVKYAAVGTLVAAGSALLLNVEGLVADNNVDRFLSGRTNKIDVFYLTSLSSDAVPALVRLAEAHPELEVVDESAFKWYGTLLADSSISESSKTTIQEEYEQARKHVRTLKDTLKQRKDDLNVHREADWKNFVFSDFKALAALGNLK